METLSYEQEKMVENIIFWATIYGDTKKFLRDKIQEQYGDVLQKTQIKRIVGMKFKDWGRLSKELLLTEGVDCETGEVSTIIQKMWNDNYNLMELIESGNFTYKKAIEEKTKKIEKTLSEIVYDDLEELYISAPVRRMVWQTILILKEIVGVMGEGPAKVFVEMARDANAEKKRTISRQKKFYELYKQCKKESRDWCKEIMGTDESKFRSKKLYLYYTQKGRCMYTGKPIDLNDLWDDNLYDIDHIYPRHFVKDDSIENNLVLVNKSDNAKKSDTYPLNSDIRTKQHNMWKELYEGGFITKEKYHRLERNNGFSVDERVGFISRQIVETRQGTKVIAELFQQTFPESEIVYAKAGNVSAFRQKFDLIKCREVNDFHHANDAYLNIVVGNVYHEKFTKNIRNFILQHDKAPDKNPYHMYRIFDFNVKNRRGDLAWDAKNSIQIVKGVMKKNTPLVTKRNYEQHGGLADQTIYSANKAKKAKGVGYVGVKTSDIRLQDTAKYGGFTSMKGAYFCLVEHTQKGKRVRTIEAIPIYMKDKLSTKEEMEAYFSSAKDFKYEEPDVRVMKIKMNSLIKVNGFYMYLTGRTGERLRVCNAVQLVLSPEEVAYVKEMKKEYDRQGDMEKNDKISKDKNMALYRVLRGKHQKGIYRLRPNSVGDELEQWEEKFESISLEKQVYVLLQIVQLSQLINQGADLSDIGGAKKKGVTSVNKRVLEYDEFELIHQSVAGLYEKEVNLLTV